MPDLAVSNDTEIIAKVQETAEILMIFKVHTYGEQTVLAFRVHSGLEVRGYENLFGTDCKARFTIRR